MLSCAKHRALVGVKPFITAVWRSENIKLLFFLVQVTPDSKTESLQKITKLANLSVKWDTLKIDEAHTTMYLLSEVRAYPRSEKVEDRRKLHAYTVRPTAIPQTIGDVLRSKKPRRLLRSKGNYEW